jgi:hypothetical protein
MLIKYGKNNNWDTVKKIAIVHKNIIPYVV